MWNRSTRTEAEQYEGGGFYCSDFEFFLWKEAAWCSVFLLSFLWLYEEVESLGAFEVAHVWKSRVTTMKPLSVVNETPTSFQISGLSGFTRRFPFFIVTSQVLSHSCSSVSHSYTHTHTSDSNTHKRLLRNPDWCFLSNRVSVKIKWVAQVPWGRRYSVHTLTHSSCHHVCQSLLPET